jgi:hypothetical protein
MVAIETTISMKSAMRNLSEINVVMNPGSGENCKWLMENDLGVNMDLDLMAMTGTRINCANWDAGGAGIGALEPCYRRVTGTGE